MTTSVILLGGGGHAKVLADAIRAAGSEVHGFVDPDPDAALGDLRHLGGDDAVLGEVVWRPDAAGASMRDEFYCQLLKQLVAHLRAAVHTVRFGVHRCNLHLQSLIFH